MIDTSVSSMSEQGGQEPQYSVRRILAIWALATLPMVLLAWIVAPLLMPRFPNLPGISVYVLLMMPGMIWQLVLSLWIIRSEEGNLHWETIRHRTWLNPPLQPRTGQTRHRLYIWLLPCLIVAGLSLALGICFTSFTGLVTRFVPWSWIALFQGSSYANISAFASPVFSGQWWALGLVLVAWVLGALFAEELLFRGILLPRMSGVFGRLDWLVNAILYALYYLYKPWMMLFRFVDALAITWPARHFRSNRMAFAVRVAEGLGLAALVLLGILAPTPSPLPSALALPFISAQPTAADYTMMMGTRTDVPVYNPNSNDNWQVDLRSTDISLLDLRNASKDLFFADFDSVTTWPPVEQMPADFDPQDIMERGKNPGLGLHQLHSQGVTGEGVNIAIIDMPLLTNHREYAAQLKWYEEMNVDVGESAQMHGPAVASIAVGETVGVAPKANLYYIGYGDNLKTGLFHSAYLALGIQRILDINEKLPEGQKIRVISISAGWAITDSDIQSAAKAAKDAGMLVISSSVDSVHGFQFHGLGRDPLANPDAFESYRPGLWWAQDYYGEGSQYTQYLMVPMDARTTASPTGVSDYVYYRQGGWSWSIPYIAGLYALAAQVDPDITPDRFWSLALETGRTIEIEHEGRNYTLSKIADPQALIAALQAGQ